MKSAAFSVRQSQFRICFLKIKIEGNVLMSSTFLRTWLASHHESLTVSRRLLYILVPAGVVSISAGWTGDYVTRVAYQHRREYKRVLLCMAVVWICCLSPLLVYYAAEASTSASNVTFTAIVPCLRSELLCSAFCLHWDVDTQETGREHENSTKVEGVVHVVMMTRHSLLFPTLSYPNRSCQPAS